jgi:hypothetical protein
LDKWFNDLETAMANVMQNSTGLTANASTTQAAAIFHSTIVKRAMSSLRIIQKNGVNDAGELYYSIVNMAAQGGLGEVESGSKNVRLGGN